MIENFYIKSKEKKIFISILTQALKHLYKFNRIRFYFMSFRD